MGADCKMKLLNKIFKKKVYYAFSENYKALRGVGRLLGYTYYAGSKLAVIKRKDGDIILRDEKFINFR